MSDGIDFSAEEVDLSNQLVKTPFAFKQRGGLPHMTNCPVQALGV